uniref:Mago nashi n=1 Tax=Picocystis salinarum TaxID=88271 RepID=A0A7S3XAZ6_9CHLO
MVETCYVRCYVGHQGRFGHEFLEFELHPEGILKYANATRYRGEGRIRKEMHLSETVVHEFAKIIRNSHILEGDDRNWPLPDASGKQELEVAIGRDHISFATNQLGSLQEIQTSQDPEGLRNFYYLVQDLKCFVLSLISLHFKVKPI